MSALRELRVFYGGTFDPVHNSHLAVALAARDTLAINGQRVCIRMMPAADPPHRAVPGASAEDRAAMLQLAIADTPGLQLDRRELERHAVDGMRRSWSIDTLQALRAEYGPEVAFAWLVGADSFVALPTWKCWRELFALTHFVVAGRPGSPLDGALPPDLAEVVAGRWVDDPAALHGAPAGLVLRLNQPLHTHSATDLRQRIASGQPWRQFMPATVADYITTHHLYGARPQGDHPRG